MFFSVRIVRVLLGSHLCRRPGRAFRFAWSVFKRGGRIAELGKLGSKEALSWLFTVLTLSLPGSIFLLFSFFPFYEENKLINKCGETLVPLLSGSGVTARCSRYRVSRVPES